MEWPSPSSYESLKTYLPELLGRGRRAIAPEIDNIKDVSQNRYSTALHPFLEFAVHLGVYGKISPSPSFCSEYATFHFQATVYTRQSGT
jgi:hypothetical protein